LQAGNLNWDKGGTLRRMNKFTHRVRGGFLVCMFDDSKGLGRQGRIRRCLAVFPCLLELIGSTLRGSLAFGHRHPALDRGFADLWLPTYPVIHDGRGVQERYTSILWDW
jgi:hypothetical protein